MTIVLDGTQTFDLHTAVQSLIEAVQAVEPALSAKDPEVHRLAVRVADIDPIDWLRAQYTPQRGCWSSRDADVIIAGIGTANVITGDGPFNAERVFREIRTVIGSSTARYFGGIRFDDQFLRAHHWRPFGSYRFILPRVDITRENGETILAVNLLPSDHNRLPGIIEILEGCAQIATEAPEKLPQFTDRRDIPNRRQWMTAVEAAVIGFRYGQLEKVVLARESRFDFPAWIDSIGMLTSLRQQTPGCFHFCFQPTPGAAFIGATPERLYLRRGRKIKSEALAGTRPRGITRERDRILGQKLLTSAKEQREHGYVADNLCGILDKLCSTLSQDKEPSLVKLTKVQHLITRFQGTLREGVEDHDILPRMHPTPAVGGFPTDKARARIRELESFDRGWYAGPVGWVTRDEAEFAVGIRSALVTGRQLRLFSGAGIVDGSHPEKEWDEIENKLGSFLKILSDR